VVALAAHARGEIVAGDVLMSSLELAKALEARRAR
jgi:hypothetical protein